MRRPTLGIATGTTVLAGLLTGCSDPAPSDTFDSGYITYSVDGTEFDEAFLVMPHRAVRLEATKVTATMDDAVARFLGLDDGELEAADGYEFVLLELELLDAPYDGDDSTDEATISIVTEEATHDITSGLASKKDYQSGGFVAAMSVPIDSPISIEITDAGKTATLDARTGERSPKTLSDSTAAYYVQWVGDLSGELVAAGVLGPSDPYVAAAIPPNDVSITVNLDGASSAPHGWISGIGWAPEGQAFLVISAISTVSNLFASPCTAGWNPAAALTLTPAGGAPVAPAAVDAEGQFDFDAGLAFALPMDTMQATLTFAPQATTSDYCTMYQPLSSSTLELALG